jgi:translation initiation factor 1 (eIF-1/SUI1)
MTRNNNFFNEYDMIVKKEDRESVVSLFNKMSNNRPGLMQEAKVKMEDRIDGTVYLTIKNMEAFDESTSKVIKRFLNSFKYKKFVPADEDENC